MEPKLGSKLGPNLVFFPFLSSLVHQFSFKQRWMIAWNNVQLQAEVKSAKRVWDPNLGQAVQIRLKNQVFHHFRKFGVVVFLKIAQDGSLEQCLTTSRGKTQEKKCLGPKFGRKRPKSGPKLGSSPFSQVQFISDPVSIIG